MEKILATVYKKIGKGLKQSIEDAFRKAVFLRLSNYIENAVYGIIFDLPDAPCYRSFCDSEIEETVQRCYDSLPQKYRDCFFVAVRCRRYKVKQRGEDAFSCENGIKGAFSELMEGKNEYLILLGEIPSDFSLLYFSDSEGCLEAGGLNALIKISVATNKNVFPSLALSKTSLGLFKKDKKASMRTIKTNFYRNGNAFSAYEGLFLRKNFRFDQKKKELFIRNIRVYDMPETEKGLAFPQITLRRDIPRFAYRASLAASRVFIKGSENGRLLSSHPSEAALTLTALPAINLFGFLGTNETLELSETLLDTLEEALYVNAADAECGKLLFLLSALASLYLIRAESDARFWSLKFRADNLISILQAHIPINIAVNEEIFLFLCYVNIPVNINAISSTPRLVKAFLSKNEPSLRSLSASDLSNPECALCALICSTNLCFNGFFERLLKTSPVFLARSSLLKRINSFSDASRRDLGEAKRKNALPFFELVFPSNPAFSPVSLRFLTNGVDALLLPYAAYLEKLYRHFHTHNNKTVVNICLLTNSFNSLTQNLIKVKPIFPSISLCIIFDGKRYPINSTHTEFKGVTLLSKKDAKGCRAAIERAALVKKLLPSTTLYDLTADFDTDILAPHEDAPSPDVR